MLDGEAPQPDHFTDASKKIDHVNNVVNVFAIEGGRSIAARDVQADFARHTEELCREFDMLAGFAVMVWDDEGQMSSVVYFGKRSGFAPSLIPGIASDMFRGDVMRADE